MARTGKYTGLINTVTYTPSGGSPTTFTGITGCEVVLSDQLVPFTGDASVFPTLMASVMGSRGLKLTGYDVSKMLRQLPKGPGTLVVKVSDAVNAPGSSGSGQITYTLVNAMRQDSPGTHQNQQPNTASVTYMGYSADGTTDPLTIAEE